MQSRISLLIFSALVCLAVLTQVGFTKETGNASEKSASAAKAGETASSLPYVAEIIADDVYIRSGPGTNYYQCGKLNNTDKVKVVGSQFSWSRIVPPAGCFSWISKQYVSVDPNNPTIGTVTGNAVHVYAGADFLKPIHSTTLQLSLNTGDKVTLLGQTEAGYCKIAPPVGTYLWVSTEYTKLLGPAIQVQLTTEPNTKPNTKPDANTSAVIQTQIPIEAEKLEEYYALQEQIKAEKTKPIDEQNYEKIKKALAEIAADKQAGKAARYVDFALKQIARYELAAKIAEEVRLQDAQLQQTEQKIEKARAAKLEQLPDLGKFVVIGQFKTSNIYGLQEELRHYRITDDSGKIICYAVPTDPTRRIDLNKFVGTKVGLIGTIEPHPQTAGALVRFTEITQMK
jgi:uncharacterized protein YgiM (DUF1202 family)